MRLGIFILSMAGGGAERVVSYLLEHCVQNDIEVHLILMNNTIEYKIPKDVELTYLENFEADENGLLTALKIPFLAYKYKKIAKKKKITHSVSFLTRPSLINILSLKITSLNYKVIINERSFPSLQYGNNDFRSVFNKFMIKHFFKFADLVISNSSESSKDLVINFNVPYHKAKVVYNPVDLDFIDTFKPLSNFFHPDKFNMISVGRLNEGKNHELIIRAIKMIDNPSLRLYILGQGPLRKYLENLISELKMEEQVFLLGFLNNPYDYLKAADLFVFGSNFEGFPNVLLEAMACGLPILSTNCKSGPSEIMNLSKATNGLMTTKYGILVPTKNLDFMSKAIDLMSKDETYLIECRLNVQKRVQHFTKETILVQYLDLINNS